MKGEREHEVEIERVSNLVIPRQSENSCVNLKGHICAVSSVFFFVMKFGSIELNTSCVEISAGVVPYYAQDSGDESDLEGFSGCSQDCV